jgi:ribonucleoside-triphosphate reductase
MMYINEEFDLTIKHQDDLHRMRENFGYNGFGQAVYYRSYSRIIRDEFGNSLGQEGWADTVIRVVNGVMSIRKDWYAKNRIKWSESYWQQYAFEMAVSLFRMEWLPPGRGLWAMGSDLVRERGAMALYNCAFSDVGKDWIEDLCWIKDTLMYGVGVGFRPRRLGLTLTEPRQVENFIVPDTREGWVDAMRHLLLSFEGKCPLPSFNYNNVRPFGAPIKSFGGTASGPDPLKLMLKTMEDLCYRFVNDSDYDEVAFKTDLGNLIGVCVVAGNVRRSAEIALCEADDPIFHGLKDYKKYPYREGWGWMSNNSVLLEKASDFEYLDEIAQANINGHDVGYLNMINMRQGRVGKEYIQEDKAIGINPCGEIPLEHREVCNLSETLPTRCVDHNRWLRACEYATFYCSTVALLPTHQPSTNAVVARNRRIGVSIIDFTGWKEQEGLASVTKYLRLGYKTVRATNKYLANEAGIPESIRVTTMKPGGSVPKMPGRTSGASHPTFRYTLRRMNVGEGTPIDRVLIDAGIPYEDSVYTPRTHVFEFPIEQGPARPATEVTLWEQAFNIVLLQREWADNAVSNTLYFKPEEQDQIADVLAHIAPLTKSVSLLPHSNAGIFKQMPEEGISKEEYERRVAGLRPIDWSKFEGSDGQDEKFCTGDTCVIL